MLASEVPSVRKIYTGFISNPGIAKLRKGDSAQEQELWTMTLSKRRMEPQQRPVFHNSRLYPWQKVVPITVLTDRNGAENYLECVICCQMEASDRLATTCCCVSVVASTGKRYSGFSMWIRGGTRYRKWMYRYVDEHSRIEHEKIVQSRRTMSSSSTCAGTDACPLSVRNTYIILFRSNTFPKCCRNWPNIFSWVQSAITTIQHD